MFIKMYRTKFQLIPLCLIIAVWGSIFLSCTTKNPSRDEIPLIRSLLGRFELAVKDYDRARLDSLISVEALDLGYSSQKILDDIYSRDSSLNFYTFGNREFAYTDKVGKVVCTIQSDSLDSGRPVEITLEKVHDVWLVKRFDLK